MFYNNYSKRKEIEKMKLTGTINWVAIIIRLLSVGWPLIYLAVADVIDWLKEKVYDYNTWLRG